MAQLLAGTAEHFVLCVLDVAVHLGLFSMPSWSSSSFTAAARRFDHWCSRKREQDASDGMEPECSEL